MIPVAAVPLMDGDFLIALVRILAVVEPGFRN
jgi:hypothetical protein